MAKRRKKLTKEQLWKELHKDHTKLRGLSDAWTTETCQPLKSEMDPDIEEEIMKILAEEIAKEHDEKDTN